MRQRFAILGSDAAAEQAWRLCPGIEPGSPEEAEFVHLSLPFPRREQVAEQFASQGRRVLCRPPMARSAEAILRLAGDGARVQPFYPARFSPRYREIRSYVARGYVGEPCILRLTWIFPREHGGPFAGLPAGELDLLDDLVLQQIDLARWIVADRVESTKAQAASVRAERDLAQVVLRFARGAAAFLECSLAAEAAAEAASLDLKGTKGIVTDRRLDGFEPVAAVCGSARGRPVRLTPEHPDWPAGSGRSVGFLFHVLDFCGATHAERRSEPATGVDDAANLRALEAVKASLASGGSEEVAA